MDWTPSTLKNGRKCGHQIDNRGETDCFKSAYRRSHPMCLKKKHVYKKKLECLSGISACAHSKSKIFGICTHQSIHWGLKYLGTPPSRPSLQFFWGPFHERALPQMWDLRTHIFISDDMMHDAAAVQHFNAIFTNYVKTKVQQPDHPFTIHFTQSDGCAAQYACATQYLWISKQFSETGIYRDWTFFCSCHGKCICDPEGGACKRKVDHEQLRDSADNPCKIANIDPDLVNFLQSEFVHPTHTTAEKKGKGVFRRHIHYIPGIYACQVYHGMCMLLFWGHVSC